MNPKEIEQLLITAYLNGYFRMNQKDFTIWAADVLEVIYEEEKEKDRHERIHRTRTNKTRRVNS